MPRRSRKKIFTITHSRYGEVQIYFEAETGIFSADVYEATVRADTKDSIIREIYKEVDARQEIEWQGCIEVKKLEPWNFQPNPYGSFAGFEIQRYWVAKRQDGKWLQSDWRNIDVSGRDQRFDHASISYDDYSDLESLMAGKKKYLREKREEFYLPYSDELWASLEDLIVRITDLDERLTKLLSTPDGIKKLMTGSSFLLTDGSKK